MHTHTDHASRLKSSVPVLVKKVGVQTRGGTNGGWQYDRFVAEGMIAALLPQPGNPVRSRHRAHFSRLGAWEP